MKKIHGLALLARRRIRGARFRGARGAGTLFPAAREITATGAGLCRLELPAEVIAACRADLADVRILGHDGREIPYIVDSPEPAGHLYAGPLRRAAGVLTAERSQRERSTTE